METKSIIIYKSCIFQYLSNKTSDTPFPIYQGYYLYCRISLGLKEYLISVMGNCFPNQFQEGLTIAKLFIILSVSKIQN